MVCSKGSRERHQVKKKKSFVAADLSLSTFFFSLFPLFLDSPCTVSRVQLLPSVRYRYSSALSGLGLEPGGERAESDEGTGGDVNVDVDDDDDDDDEELAAAAETPPAATTEPLTAAVPADAAEEDEDDGDEEGEDVLVADAFLFLLAVFGAASSFLVAKHLWSWCCFTCCTRCCCCCWSRLLGARSKAGGVDEGDPLPLPLGPQASPLDARRASMEEGTEEDKAGREKEVEEKRCELWFWSLEALSAKSFFTIFFFSPPRRPTPATTDFLVDLSFSLCRC